ncbi:MAG: putative quinol monooxygenase [Paracoccaceae bacterium]
MYAVCVTFEISNGQMDAFMPLMKRNAALSRNTEEGCLQFDVLTEDTRPNEVFLYEIYTDRSAFDTHLASSHFQSFDAEVASMIKSKKIRTYTRVAR